jgi:hypothetical protein
MLTSISWLQYLQALAMLIAGYYSVVILLYYRIELCAILQRIKSGKSVREPERPRKEVLGKIAENQEDHSLNSEELEFSQEDLNQPIEENH